jgi:hypothetical protein
MSNVTMSNLKDFETPVEQTMDLPPLAILRIGDKAKFVLGEVAVVKDGTETRLYYRGTLLEALECQTKEKGAEDYMDITYDSGFEVTIPGSGSLDYNLARIANKKAGEAVNVKADETTGKTWASIKGDLFIIERLGDDKLSKGKHKGKAVKTYKVEYAAKKSK